MGLRLCHGDSALEAIELPEMVRAGSRPAEGVGGQEGIAVGSVRERENMVVAEHARDVTQDFWGASWKDEQVQSAGGTRVRWRRVEEGESRREGMHGT